MQSVPKDQRQLSSSTAAPAAILCVGMGWFPTAPGGLSRYVYDLTAQLASGEDWIELCGTDLPLRSPSPALTLTTLASEMAPLPQRLWQTQKNFQQRQMLRPDAINLHFALYSLPLLRHLPPDVPISFTFHGPWAIESQQEGASQPSVWLKQWVEQTVYRRCDRFIVLSQAFGTILHQSYGVPWERIHVIPGGVDTQRFQPTLSRSAAREQLGWPTDRPILFSPRRLVQRVGLEELLHAMVRVKQQIPEVWLAIAGKGPQRSALERQVQELGLQDQVRLLGYVADQDLPIAYQAADLTVVPSQSLEGFGLILLESLACGTPPLCTPVGGMPEVIAPFSPDLVTEAANAAAIADRLIDLLRHPTTLPNRDACRQYACDRFNWRAIAAQVRAVLLSELP